MKPVSVKMEDELVDRLERVAWKKRLSKSALIRLAIINYLREESECTPVFQGEEL